MRQKLQQLSEQAMSLIKNPSLTDAAIIARLAPLPAKLQQMERNLADLEVEANAVERLLQGLNGAIHPTETEKDDHAPEPSFRMGRKPQTKLRIEVDAKFLGGEKRTFFGYKASDTLAAFVTYLCKVKGTEVLEKLSKYKVNRAPLVTREPKKDYRYRKGYGEAEYQHQPIGDSGFCVFTNSTTQEKREAVEGAWRLLGFPPDAIKVEVVEKHELLNQLVV
jgi:hypothetical protein